METYGCPIFDLRFARASYFCKAELLRFLGSDTDDTEPLESSEEEDTADEDEDDGEEYIGGDFNEEVRKQKSKTKTLKVMYPQLTEDLTPYRKLQPGNDSGCTAVVGLLVGRDLYVANAGDSRCIVCRDGKAIEMSFDHKPEDEPERARINKAGGKVTQDGRVNGGLNLSRAIGDHAYKTNKSLPLQQQMISPVPDVKKLTLQPDTDTFVFLACDGIWNSLSSQEVVDFINKRMKLTESDSLEESKKLTKIIEEVRNIFRISRFSRDFTFLRIFSFLIIVWPLIQWETVQDVTI